MSAIPAAAMPANGPSAETPTQIAAGESTRNGSAVRAEVSLPSARIVTATQTGASEPSRMHTTPAQAPPLSPMRSSPMNSRNPPGGPPATWIGQALGGPEAMCWVKERSIAAMLVTPAAAGGYSSGVANRFAMPRCQPSIDASPTVHATTAPYDHSSSQPHRRVRANAKPRHDHRHSNGQRDRRARR